MPEIRREALVPHGADDLFGLILDVRRYPEFVPHLERVEVHAEAADAIEATLHVRRGVVHVPLRTRNTFERPRHMHLQLVAGPFSAFAGDWRLTPISDAGCRIGLELRYVLVPGVLAVAAGALIGQMASRMVDVFCERADVLYG